MRRRLHFLVVLFVFAGLASAEETSPRCKVFGLIFSIDPFGETLLLKDAGGYLKSVKLPSGAIISKLPVTSGDTITQIRRTDLNTGDLACVHGGEGNAPLQLSVVRRTDLHQAQADFLVGWQRNSLYGVLTSIDVSGRAFVVKPLAPSNSDMPVRISVPESARLRAALPDARSIQESASFRLEDVKPGEPVYVRGSRSGNGSDMTASLVLRGGYRGILGTLIEVQTLSSLIRIREFGTDKTLTIKMALGAVYRTTENITDPMRVETASGVVLAPVGLADIQPGDAILIIGKTAEGTSKGDGLAAVTKFGTFGVVPKDPQGRISWLIAK